MTRSEVKAERWARGENYPAYVTLGSGQEGGQNVRKSEYLGDQVGRPPDEVAEFNPNFPKTQAPLASKEIPKAEVCFPKGTTIFPINPANGRPRGARTLLGDLNANRVYGKNGKQRKVRGLSLWEAASKAEIWNGRSKREYHLYPGDKFTAYVRNARRLQNK